MTEEEFYKDTAAAAVAAAREVFDQRMAEVENALKQKGLWHPDLLLSFTQSSRVHLDRASWNEGEDDRWCRDISRRVQVLTAKPVETDVRDDDPLVAEVLETFDKYVLRSDWTDEDEYFDMAAEVARKVAKRNFPEMKFHAWDKNPTWEELQRAVESHVSEVTDRVKRKTPPDKLLAAAKAAIRRARKMLNALQPGRLNRKARH